MIQDIPDVRRDLEGVIITVIQTLSHIALVMHTRNPIMTRNTPMMIDTLTVRVLTQNTKMCHPTG